jgi:hypothetical protein
MDKNTSDNLIMEIIKVMENFLIRIFLFMRETSVRILLTVLESIIGKMEINSKEITKME